MKETETIEAIADIEPCIQWLRGLRVLLDADLAKLYGVETKALKRAVARNQGRFSADFMFRLTEEEYRSLRRQFGTLKRGEHAKYLPLAFTEQGVAMLSGVLRSSRAVQANIAIMRAFVRLRRALETHKMLAKKLDELDAKVGTHDEELKLIFEAIRQLTAPQEKKKKAIGFTVKEDRAKYQTRQTQARRRKR